MRTWFKKYWLTVLIVLMSLGTSLWAMFNP